MIGNNLSKKSLMSGQVLLLLILVLGTLLVVAMTAMFQTSTNTQISGIEQQSQITLAAAEAAIEKALQTGQDGTFAELGLTNLTNISLENSRVVITQERPYIYTTPNIPKDGQYTMYLAEYTGSYPNYFGDSYQSPFYIFYQSKTPECNDVSMELTVLYDAGGVGNIGDGNYEMKKFIIDPGNKITTDNSLDLGEPASATYAGATVGTPEYTLDGNKYSCRSAKFNTSELPNVKMVLAQVYFSSTRLAFAVDGYENLPDAQPLYDFPPQGRLVTATARAKISTDITPVGGGSTPTSVPGLTRTAQIFQSYPQIPAEFWITSF